MEIANEEVGIELGEVQRNVPDGVSTVDTGEDVVALADADEVFEGLTHAGHGGDGVEYGHLDFVVVGVRGADGGFEAGEHFFIAEGVVEGDDDRLRWRRFAHG